MKPVCELIEKYKNRWQWCALCRCPIVIYTCCGNSTCNGGGCDKCDKTYEETREIEHNNLTPTIDQITNAIDAQRKSDLHWYMRNKQSIIEEPDWYIRIQKYFNDTGVPLIIPTEKEQLDYKPDNLFFE